MKNLIKQSYESDKIAFIFESISCLLAISSSMYLSLMTNDAIMIFVFSAFLISAISGVIAFYIRGLAWPLILNVYFILINLFGKRTLDLVNDNVTDNYNKHGLYNRSSHIHSALRKDKDLILNKVNSAENFDEKVEIFDKHFKPIVFLKTKPLKWSMYGYDKH